MDILRFNTNNWTEFEKLFDKYYRMLCFYATKKISDSIASEDIVQDVFYGLWKVENKAFNDESTIKSYLFGAVNKRCLNYIRDSSTHTIKHSDISVELNFELDNIIDEKAYAQTIDKIMALVEILPNKCREIFCRTYLYNESDQSVADALGLSVHTVRTQKMRAKKFIREEFEKSHNRDLFVFVILLELVSI